jgi:glycerol uptake facilitator protein
MADSDHDRDAVVDVEDLKGMDDEPKTPSIFYQMVAECIGTMFLVMIGVSAVYSAVLTKGVSGNFQVGITFAIGIMWGIYLSGSISGGHINPAVTFALGLLRPKSFPAWKIPCYWFAQTLGAFIGGGINYILWRTTLEAYEATNSIVRGTPASDISASTGICVFPFPAAAKDSGWPSALISPGQALLVEAFGTALLCFVVFMILDPRNTTFKNKDGAPIIIGLTVGTMITIFGPLTGAGLNPARDFGPRIIAAIAGYGRRAFPGKDGGFWVYIVGPLIGGPIGGALYDLVLARAYSGKAF